MHWTKVGFKFPSVVFFRYPFFLSLFIREKKPLNGTAQPSLENKRKKTRKNELDY